MLKNKKEEIILKWAERVFNDPRSQKNLNESFSFEKLKFENPLLFEAIGEFNKIFDYVVSEDQNEKPPLAETLIKFRALNSENSENVINYPVHLRNVIIDIFSANEYKNIEILLSINDRIDKLLFAAVDFLMKTREDIYKIKLNELRQGTFANETTGCPSALWQNEAQVSR